MVIGEGFDLDWGRPFSSTSEGHEALRIASFSSALRRRRAPFFDGERPVEDDGDDEGDGEKG